MRSSWLAVLLLCASFVPARAADAALAPNGDTLWNFAAGQYLIAVDVYPGSALGTMTIADSLTGRSAIGTLYPAAVVDRPHGSLDEFLAEGFFQNEVFFPFLGLGDIAPGSNPTQATVHIGLGDLDGVAFDGALPGFAGQFLLPVNPPPLSVFETNTLVITHFEFDAALNDFAPITQTLAITALPEPALGLLAAPLVAALALRGRARRADRHPPLATGQRRGEATLS